MPRFSDSIEGMQAYIKKHGADFPGHRIKVSWERQGRKVHIEFEVHKRYGTEFFTDPAYTADWSKNWGLWNHDVVESFLQLRRSPDDTTAPYLEIQVSPLNQPFALLIVEPRVKFHAPAELTFVTTSVTEGKIWKAQLEVSLPQELKGDYLFGGFFACLNQSPREFYALELNPEDRPDFHRPELFQQLDQ